MRKNTPMLNTNVVRGAYTVVELLVVIVIAGLLLTIAVPAFQSTIYSSNRSLAVNAIQAASVMGRDVAVNTGKDGAIVFVYDPDVQRIQIIPAIRVGTMRETTTAPTGTGSGGGPSSVGFGDQPYFDRDVFVPAPVGEVLTLPDSWMVRGYAPPGLLLDYDSAGRAAADWYDSDLYGDDNVDISNPSNPKSNANWLFPETGFFARNAQVSGGSLDGSLSNVNPNLPTARQSFMIRFDGRTGAVSRDTRSALFVDLRNSLKRPWPEVERSVSVNDSVGQSRRSNRIDLAENLESWASRVLNSPDLDGDTFGYDPDDGELREQLIGNASNDTILVKPVSRIALYDENKLALGVGARGVNRDTGTLYMPRDQEQRNGNIEFDMRLFMNTAFSTTDEDEVLERINQWIDGNTTYISEGDTQIDFDDEPDSRLFLVQSYTGELKEILR
jgi:type II secretory pathway pseudopilin PulG